MNLRQGTSRRGGREGGKKAFTLRRPHQKGRMPLGETHSFGKKKELPDRKKGSVKKGGPGGKKKKMRKKGCRATIQKGGEKKKKTNKKSEKKNLVCMGVLQDGNNEKALQPKKAPREKKEPFPCKKDKV